MSSKDIRWQQRFENYLKALGKLEMSIAFIQDAANSKKDYSNDKSGNDQSDILDDLIKQGLIQSFEFTHELGWNVIKDYAAYQGNPEIRGSRDAVRIGFAMNLIEKPEVWMEMIVSRNKTSHTYDADTAEEIFTRIIRDFFPAFIALREKMRQINEDNP